MVGTTSEECGCACQTSPAKGDKKQKCSQTLKLGDSVLPYFEGFFAVGKEAVQKVPGNNFRVFFAVAKEADQEFCKTILGDFFAIAKEAD